VRLAQRVPVRIAIDRVLEGQRLLSGRTATVAVRPGTAEAGRRAAAAE
jgi:multidrug resistance efflux pump